MSKKKIVAAAITALSSSVAVNAETSNVPLDVNVHESKLHAKIKAILDDKNDNQGQLLHREGP